MVPMIDTMMFTPGAMVITLGPTFVVMIGVLVAGVAWMAWETAKELHRTAVEGECRTITIASSPDRRAA